MEDSVVWAVLDTVCPAVLLFVALGVEYKIGNDSVNNDSWVGDLNGCGEPKRRDK